MLLSGPASHNGKTRGIITRAQAARSSILFRHVKLVPSFPPSYGYTKLVSIHYIGSLLTFRWFEFWMEAVSCILCKVHAPDDAIRPETPPSLHTPVYRRISGSCYYSGKVTQGKITNRETSEWVFANPKSMQGLLGSLWLHRTLGSFDIHRQYGIWNQYEAYGKYIWHKTTHLVQIRLKSLESGLYLLRNFDGVAFSCFLAEWLAQFYTRSFYEYLKLLTNTGKRTRLTHTAIRNILHRRCLVKSLSTH